MERQALLEWDTEYGIKALADSDEYPINQLRGHFIMYRTAVVPRQGRKDDTLQTLPGVEEACSGCAAQAVGLSSDVIASGYRRQSFSELEPISRAGRMQSTAIRRASRKSQGLSLKARV